MILPGHCTVAYRVNAAGRTPLQLAGTLSAPPPDPQMMALLGVTLTSDSTSNDATSATRTIEFGFTATFDALFPFICDQRAPFWNMMTNILSQAVGSPVIAAAPVLSP